jgi:hypothetical protein
MTTSISSSTRALAALLLAGAATVAHAGAGNGIRLGGSEARLHPFLDLESRYDSNVWYSTEEEAIADVILHVRPGLELEIPGSRAAIEFSGAVDWAQYLGVEQDTGHLSKLYGDARLAAVFNRGGAMGARVDNDFRRQISATSLAASGLTVISNTNVLSVAMPWKPGGGALLMTANGQWLVETFEKYRDEPDFDLADAAYNQFRGGADLQWRFLPRTSAIVSAGWFTRVPNGADRPDEATGFDAMAGLTGLLTPRIAATVKAGYGSTSAPATDASSFLADLGVEWLPAESISFSTGYTRSFGFDPTDSVFVADTVSAGVKLKLANRFLLRGGVRYDRLAFQAVSSRDTTFLRIDPAIEGMVTRWLKVGIGYVYSARDAEQPQLPDYTKNEAWLKLGLTY